MNIRRQLADFRNSNDSDKIVAVYVNMAYETKSIATEFVNMTATPVSNKRYITNIMYNLRKYGSSTSDVYDSTKELSVPARSVMTVVYELNNPSGIRHLTTYEKLDIFPNPVQSGQSIQIKIPADINLNQGIVSIYSVGGKLIDKKALPNSNNDFELSIPSYITSGIYYLVIMYYL